MKFEEVKKEEDKYLMHTYKRKDVMFVRGEGTKLYDSEGKEYLDFIAGIASDSLGHCHPAVVKAVQKQAEKLIHVSNYYYIEHRAQVAKLISDMGNKCIPRFFSAPWQTFFTNSGAEANECAIKLARLWAKERSTGGYTIITLEGSFHGRTLATLAATGQPDKQEPFQPLPDGFVQIPINDVDALRRAVIATPVAALMIEPIQGESGVHPIDPDFLEEAMHLARTAGFLVIADEVQTGCYRCGTYPFGFQGLGFNPDIFTMAKGIASGFPMGACVARPEVAEVFTPGMHGSTFGGSNLAMAAAEATLETLEMENYGERVARTGAYFAKKLIDLDVFASLRGAGLLLAVDLEEGLDANRVVDEALKAGFVLNATGPSTLRFAPPLNIDKTEIDELIDALPEILEKAAQPEPEPEPEPEEAAAADGAADGEAADAAPADAATEEAETEAAGTDGE